LESFASHVAFLNRGRLLFAEDAASLAARFREIEITLDSSVVRDTDWRGSWLGPEQSGTVVRFVESQFEENITTAEIYRRYPNAPFGGDSSSQACGRRSPRSPARWGQQRCNHVYSVSHPVEGVQCLRLEIATSLALLLLVTTLDILRSDAVPRTCEGMLNLLLAAAWALLIGRLVLQDPLTGDQQFWVTRPYGKGRLFYR
jgi:hypothetical protein